MIPIGRGQRELVIGDRQTGKTAICVDAILNQKDINASDDESQKALLRLRCYRSETVNCCAQIVKTLEDNGALEYSIRCRRDSVRACAIAIPGAVRRLRHG